MQEKRLPGIFSLFNLKLQQENFKRSYFEFFPNQLHNSVSVQLGKKMKISWEVLLCMVWNYTGCVFVWDSKE